VTGFPSCSSLQWVELSRSGGALALPVPNGSAWSAKYALGTVPGFCPAGVNAQGGPTLTALPVVVALNPRTGAVSAQHLEGCGTGPDT
jgi:hypothetical protein